MLTNCGRFPIQFHLNAGQQHAPLYDVPRARQPPQPHPTTAATAASPLPSLKLQFSHWGGCVCERGREGRLDWQATGYSCHSILCILSLCVQRAAERITVKWDDINYPNPDSSLWNSASTHLSQERPWMVRQGECQRNEMKADKFSREYSNKLTEKGRIIFPFSWFHGGLIVSLIQIFHPHIVIEKSTFFASLNILILQEGHVGIHIHMF